MLSVALRALRPVLFLLPLFLGLSAHAQLTVEEIAGLRSMPKLDAMQFLTGKGYKLDSCGLPDAGNEDLTSTCSWKIKRQIDQKLFQGELKVSFSKTQKNIVYYTPFQVGIGQKMAVYLKTQKGKEEAFDNIREQTYGKKYFLEGFTYDISQSAKRPDWESITIYPTK